MRSQQKTPFKYLINIRWSDEDAAFVAEVPELPGCASHGATYEKAAANARVAIREWLKGAREAGIKIPEPVVVSSYSGKFLLRTGERLHRLLAVRAAQSGQSLNKFVIGLLGKVAS